MKQHTWNDGRLPGGRYPTLWIVHNRTIHTFDGKAIPGVVAIAGDEWVKAGQWSNTTYQLALADGAVACELLAPLHGQTWPENDRTAAYERFIGNYKVAVSFEAFDAALLRDFPGSHKRMLEGEAALASLDSEEGESELVEISTSQSCARNPHSDVLVTAPNGQEWVVAHEARELEIPGVCKLVARDHTPGRKGGITTLTFAVAEGVSISHRRYPKDGEPDATALGRRV